LAGTVGKNKKKINEIKKEIEVAELHKKINEELKQEESTRPVLLESGQKQTEEIEPEQKKPNQKQTGENNTTEQTRRKRKQKSILLTVSIGVFLILILYNWAPWERNEPDPWYEAQLDPVNDTQTDPGNNMQLDLNIEPVYLDTTLNSGFEPDPYTIFVNSGGPISLENLNLGVDCKGFASQAPDFRLHWIGPGTLLNIYFKADTGDATLVINAPDEKWYCNDDGYGNTLNPLITFSNAQNGQYDIWVGSIVEGEFLEGELYISEYEIEIR
jgi:hypothetical protein